MFLYINTQELYGYYWSIAFSLTPRSDTHYMPSSLLEYFNFLRMTEKKCGEKQLMISTNNFSSFLSNTYPLCPVSLHNEIFIFLIKQISYERNHTHTHISCHLAVFNFHIVNAFNLCEIIFIIRKKKAAAHHTIPNKHTMCFVICGSHISIFLWKISDSISVKPIEFYSYWNLSLSLLLCLLVEHFRQDFWFNPFGWSFSPLLNSLSSLLVRTGNVDKQMNCGRTWTTPTTIISFIISTFSSFSFDLLQCVIATEFLSPKKKKKIRHHSRQSEWEFMYSTEAAHMFIFARFEQTKASQNGIHCTRRIYWEII